MDMDEYQVIADFPASMFEVGDKFKVYTDKGRVYAVQIDDVSEKIDVRDFPHLFKKINS